MKNNQIEPLVSVVIPLYNASLYLRETIDSLLMSTYKNIEIILINDFSTDNTVEIVKEYMRIDNRIKLINRDSKGGNASKGITFAIPFCKGEYFFYMSQDDFISLKCIQDCVEKAVSTKAEIVVPVMIPYLEGRDNSRFKLVPPHSFDVCDSGKDAFLLATLWKIGGFALRSMDLVRKHPFVDDYYDSCDSSGCNQCFYSNKVAYSQEIFFYRQNQNAITHNFSLINLDSFHTHNMEVRFMISKGYDKTAIMEVVKAFICRRIELFKKLNKSNLSVDNYKKGFDLILKSDKELSRILLKNKLYNSTFAFGFYLQNACNNAV